MNRNIRTLIVVLVATLTAGIATFTVYTAVRSLPVREVEVAHLYVTVAAKSLPTGARITERDVKLVAWPSTNPVAGSFDKVDGVINRGLLSAVLENEPLTESKLAPLAAGAGLPPTIPPGMRAMSVKVDEVIGVAGFVVPGTRVDLVVTLRRNGGPSEESMSRTVVGNVLVLTAGTRLDQEEAKDGKPQPSTVVTLAVLPEDAERIALAASEGTISLALRNPLDVDPTDTKGIAISALMRADAPPPPPAASAPARRASRPAIAPVAAPPAAPSVYMVETIRAAKRNSEMVQ